MNRPLIEYLPSFMQKSNIYQALFEASETAISSIESSIEDLKAQDSIDTATWALAIYERDLGIPTESGKALSERRSAIKSKERGTGKADANLFETVALAYTNGEVDVAFDGTIQITFSSFLGTPPNVDDLKMVLEDIKPAHLDISYIYIYRLYEDLEPYTHADLSAYTYNDLREGELI